MQIYIYFLIVKQYLKICCERKFINYLKSVLSDLNAFIITFIGINKISYTLGPNISLISFNINKGDSKFPLHTILLVV